MKRNAEIFIRIWKFGIIIIFFLLNWVRPRGRGLDRPSIYLVGKGTAPPMTIDMLPCLVRQLIPVTRCRCIHRRCLSSRSNQKWIEKQIIPLQFHPTIHWIHYYTLSAMLMTIPPLTNILNPITWIVFDAAL